MDQPRRQIPPVSPPARRIKLLSVGDCQVGKSCLIKRYCEKRFVARYLPTIGLDYGVTSLARGDANVRVCLFDLSGDSLYLDVRTEFYDVLEGVLLVYDVSKPSTFTALRTWVEELERNSATHTLSTAHVFVVGNKTDLPRHVDEAEARLWAESRHYHYHETSANTGEGVDELFAMACWNVYDDVYLNKPRVAVAPRFTLEDAEAVKRCLHAQDDYEVLGVAKTSPRDDIQHAYKRSAAELHPDKNQAPGSEEAFKRVLSARTRLLSAKTR